MTRSRTKKIAAGHRALTPQNLGAGVEKEALPHPGGGASELVLFPQVGDSLGLGTSGLDSELAAFGALRQTAI